MTEFPEWVLRYMFATYKDKGRGPDEFDCWGLVRQIQMDQFGVELPSLASEYASALDRPSVAVTVQRYTEELSRAWRIVTEPMRGDIVVLRIGGVPWHCGVIIADDWMLHILGDAAVAREQISREPWKNRIEGIYRHASKL